MARSAFFVGQHGEASYGDQVANRAYLLSLPFPPRIFGEQPPSGTVAVAKWSIPLFWATLFDRSSVIEGSIGGTSGFAAPRLEGYARSERRLEAIATNLGWSSWPIAERWFAFLRSLEQPWIAVDASDVDHDARRLYEIARIIDRPSNDPDFEDYFGVLDADDMPDEGSVVAGFDREGSSPPAPLSAIRGSSVPPPPPSLGGEFEWSRALEGLLAESDPQAWARWFPHAHVSSFRSDVAVVGPGAFVWYAPRAQAWTVLWASTIQAAMEVFGVAPPPAAPLESYPPLPPDIVGLDDGPLSYERLVRAATELGDPVAPGRAPSASGRPFETLVDRATISYFVERAPHEEPVAVLFRGSPIATPWS